MTEGQRIADQMKRAYDGSAWHGPPLMELLQGIDAVAAHRRPIPNAHTIAELVAHITFWKEVVTLRAQGRSPRLATGKDWVMVSTGARAWKTVLKQLRRSHDMLVAVAAAADDTMLARRVAGKPYNVYVMLHGVVQHDLYHAGQIALLAKGLEEED